VSFAARCAEIFELPFGAVQKLTNQQNVVTYKVCYKQGYVYDAIKYTLIAGEIQVAILDEYMALFTPADMQAEPRFFSKTMPMARFHPPNAKSGSTRQRTLEKSSPSCWDWRTLVITRDIA